jgi:hypothetical protein
MKIGKFSSEECLEYEVIVFHAVSIHLLKSIQSIAKLIEKQHKNLKQIQSVIGVFNFPRYNSSTFH